MRRRLVRGKCLGTVVNLEQQHAVRIVLLEHDVEFPAARLFAYRRVTVLPDGRPEVLQFGRHDLELDYEDEGLGHALRRNLSGKCSEADGNDESYHDTF